MTATASSQISVRKGEHYVIPSRASLPYQHIKPLGLGSTAFVELVRDTDTGRLFAHKRFRRYQDRDMARFHRDFQAEVNIVKRLSFHPHIVGVFATYISGRDAGMILDPAASDGDLATYLQSIGDAGQPPTRDQSVVLKRAFGCLANGLAYIHEKTIRHKDVKPQNILIHQGFVKYTDFGIALDASQHDNTSTFGTALQFTRRYCAPEVASSEKRNRKSDVFSLGCVYVEMLTVLEPNLQVHFVEGFRFYEHIDYLCFRLAGLTHRSSPWVGLSEVCSRMLVHKPEGRTSAKGLVEELSWLKTVGRSPLPECFCAGSASDEESMQKNSSASAAIARGSRHISQHDFNIAEDPKVYSEVIARAFKAVSVGVVSAGVAFSVALTTIIVSAGSGGSIRAFRPAAELPSSGFWEYWGITALLVIFSTMLRVAMTRMFSFGMWAAVVMLGLLCYGIVTGGRYYSVW